MRLSSEVNSPHFVFACRVHTVVDGDLASAREWPNCPRCLTRIAEHEAARRTTADAAAYLAWEHEGQETAAPDPMPADDVTDPPEDREPLPC